VWPFLLSGLYSPTPPQASFFFFNSNVKVGDRIQLLEGKDHLIDGVIEEIGLFFMTLRSPDDEEIVLPNNVFITKLVKKVKS